jgi:uncharacterized membrane protein YozB (DUF420 family)
MSVTDLPLLNASLNGLSAALLLAGWLLIRRRRVAAHKACMASAVVVSTAFLCSYLIYHAQVGSVPFPGTGLPRTIYFVILITHVVLAAAIVPLVAVTLVRAWRGDFARHRRIARVTWPLWMYVSVTGVIIYIMLYVIYGAARRASPEAIASVTMQKMDSTMSETPIEGRPAGSTPPR